MSEPTNVQVQTAITKDWAWVTAHSVLLLIAGLLIIGGIYGVESLIARHDADNNAKWQTILTQQTAQTEALQHQIAQDEQNWQAQNVQLQTAIGSLAQSIAKRDAAEQQQQKVDSTLDAAGAAQRIAQQTDAASGEVTANGNSVVLDTPISRVVASRLDVLASTQADLSDTKQQLAAETTVATNNANDVAEQKRLVTAQQDRLVTEQKSCQAEITQVKAEARKSKWHWFLAGAATAGAIALKFL